MSGVGSDKFLAHHVPVTLLVLRRIAEGGGLRDRRAGDLLDRAVDRGAFPILYRFLRAAGEQLPAGGRALWLEHAARMSLYRTELARVHDVVEPITEVVVLKGEPLAELLFGDGLLRNTTDMDLLIEPRRIEEIVGALAELGYRPLHADEAKTWAYNQHALIHERYGTLIELHWRIAFPHLPSPPISELLGQTIPVTVGDRSYRSLDPELLFLHLCYHFHQHRGFLKGLLDITGWIDRFEGTADLRAIRDRARALGIEGLIQWPLHTLRLFTGYRSRLYDPHADAFARAWAGHTSAKLERDFVELRPAPSFERWLADQSFGAKVITSLAQGASMAVVDGVPQKIASAIGPVIFGPHRLGRAVFAALERLGAVDRDELYEGRILG